MHELELAQRFADTLICIRDGRIDRAGPPEEVLTGGYIERLYGMDRGTYDCLTGTTEAGRTGAAGGVASSGRQTVWMGGTLGSSGVSVSTGSP